MSSPPPLWRRMATGISGWGMDVNPPRRMTVGWASSVRNGIRLDSQGRDAGTFRLEARQGERSLNAFGERRPRSVRANIKTRRINRVDERSSFLSPVIWPPPSTGSPLLTVGAPSSCDCQGPPFTNICIQRITHFSGPSPTPSSRADRWR